MLLLKLSVWHWNRIPLKYKSSVSPKLFLKHYVDRNIMKHLLTIILIYYQDLEIVIHKNTLHETTAYMQGYATKTFPVLINFIAVWTIVICISCFFMNANQLIITSVLLNMKRIFFICYFEEGNVVFSFLIPSSYKFVNTYCFFIFGAAFISGGSAIISLSGLMLPLQTKILL